MPERYTTKQGDTFESIAWFRLGNSNLMGNLIRANRAYMDVAVFDAGISLALPDEEEVAETAEASTNPPWR
ncbi:MAG: hypothetical protein IJ206_09135 [Oscillospiraceae bacterium]|nr:hypothetical protein [Oscillospiraceae bacterium]